MSLDLGTRCRPVTLADLAMPLPHHCAACELELTGAWVWCDWCFQKVHEGCVHQRTPFRAVMLGVEVIDEAIVCRGCSGGGG